MIGKELTSNPAVRKLGFTGSTEIGKLLMAQCAPGLKKVSLELGGNAPFIVFDDADLDDAVAGALLCKFRNSGQTCISANRLLVQDGIYDAFLERFASAVAELKVADGFTPGVNVGPLIDEPAVEKVARHVADALDGGAEVVLGGNRLDGQFFEPSVLVGVTDRMAMSSEETFGPVAGIARFSTEEEAVRIANDTPYGLAAYFYSRSLDRVTRVGEALEYGILGVNTGLISTEVAPFGGVKESGIGREGSSYGIDEWLELKYWALGGIGDTAVIVEQRDYHVYTGKLPELLRLYESEGIPLQEEILGGLVGAFTTDIGALSTYTTLWRYDSFAEREDKRGRLQADERWQAFLRKVQPLMHTQQNRILVPTSFSPLR